MASQAVNATSRARISGSSLLKKWEMNYIRNYIWEYGAVWTWPRVHHLSNLIKRVVGDELLSAAWKTHCKMTSPFNDVSMPAF